MILQILIILERNGQLIASTTATTAFKFGFTYALVPSEASSLLGNSHIH